MAEPTDVRFCKPFYDGLGSPLIGAEVTLRNAIGNHIFYECIELHGDLVGCYYADVTTTDNYWIWVKPSAITDAACVGSWSPAFIPSVYTPHIGGEDSFVMDEALDFVVDEALDFIMCET